MCHILFHPPMHRHRKALQGSRPLGSPQVALMVRQVHYGQEIHMALWSLSSADRTLLSAGLILVQLRDNLLGRLHSVILDHHPHFVSLSLDLVHRRNMIVMILKNVRKPRPRSSSRRVPLKALPPRSLFSLSYLLGRRHQKIQKACLVFLVPKSP